MIKADFQIAELETIFALFCRRVESEEDVQRIFRGEPCIYEKTHLLPKIGRQTIRKKRGEGKYSSMFAFIRNI